MGGGEPRRTQEPSFCYIFRFKNMTYLTQPRGFSFSDPISKFSSSQSNRRRTVEEPGCPCSNEARLAILMVQL